MPDRIRHRRRGIGDRRAAGRGDGGPWWAMPASPARKTDLRVAVAGNPNAGKTSIFNALTGQHQHIGNYPGVTVEKKTGRVQRDGISMEVVDLPGTYSLSAYSIEEMVAREFVLKEKPDVIVDVLDSTNLERHLYLLLQFQEMGIPVLGVLNMSDEARAMGLEIDDAQLARILGIPFVKTVGHRGEGVRELIDRLVGYARGQVSLNGRRINYGRDIERRRAELIEELATDPVFAESINLDWLAIKLLEDDDDAVRKVERGHERAADVLAAANQARRRIERAFDESAPVVVAEQRYAYIHGAVKETVRRRELRNRIDLTEAIDRVVLNRHAGLFIFFAVMFLIYQVTFALGNPLSDLIDRGFGNLAAYLAGVLPPGILADLVVNGIIGGVGGVLVFLPLVVLLFIGLSLLEDSGYMARAAFVMDRLFHMFGMHGRSFVPFMIATGCAVPAVMSARTLVNPRDRIITVLVTPLLMCGAKSPVIAMLAAAFFPERSGTIFWLVWLGGWLIAFAAALVLRNTMFRGEAAPFVMELPPYRRPTLSGAFTHMWERAWMYLRKAGTFILAASVVIWFLLAFPRPAEEVGAGLDRERASARDGSPAQIEDVAADATVSAHVRNSYAGRIGRFIEPVMEPLGFDWKISVALLSGFAAKEVFISTMGIVYGIEETDADVEGNSERTPLKQRLVNDPAYSPAAALALMFFVLLYVPCMAVMAVVWKELGAWRWTLFLAVYTFAISWALAFAVYNVSLFFGLGA
ncbi:MAG: Fe(2+) transporter FeoB [Calditrichaeota bacterium]|nr:Fe(2+) transporter FeoB [Calditrichota bacterium]